MAISKDVVVTGVSTRFWLGTASPVLVSEGISRVRFCSQAG